MRAEGERIYVDLNRLPSAISAGRASAAAIAPLDDMLRGLDVQLRLVFGPFSVPILGARRGVGRLTVPIARRLVETTAPSARPTVGTTSEGSDR